jgi:16S rRNA (guanine527-N7)-methyltransferase
LNEWQRTINLVAPKTLGEIWHRHFADSAQLWALIPPTARRLVDLGSGAGFPGLVLAVIAAERRDPQAPLRAALVESDTRKAAFLRNVAGRLGIAVDIIPTRIESMPKSASLEPIDVITSRALAPLPRLFEFAEPLFQPPTVALFLKGRAVEEEICEANQGWTFDLDQHVSLTDPASRIIVIRNLQRNKEG